MIFEWGLEIIRSSLGKLSIRALKNRIAICDMRFFNVRTDREATVCV